MEEIVICLGTHRSAGENFGCTWEDLRVPAKRQGAPMTNLGALMTSLGVPMTSLGSPTTSLGASATTLGAQRLTVEQPRINNIFFGIAAGASGNHSYNLSFNDC